MFSISFAAKPNTTIDKDYIFKTKIIGPWSEGGLNFGISIFKEGGLYEALVYETPKQLKLIFKMEGKWWIKNGLLYNTVHKIIPPIYPVIEEPSIDVIVEITDDIMILIDEAGKKYYKNRVK